MTDRVLGRIVDAKIAYEDHGILTCFIGFDFGGSNQGFGDYPLDTWDETEKRRVGTAAGMEFLIGVMAAVGVESWDALLGKEVWIEREEGNSGWEKIVVIEAPAYRKHTRKFDVREWQRKWTGSDGKVKV